MSDYNQHLVNAVKSVQSESVYVEEAKATFHIQSGPVGEEGRNGCDATDLLRFSIGLYQSFNKAHPCRENSVTITKLEEALMWQEKRTAARNERGVEGTNVD